MKDRLQKILAHAGVASRRAAEALITTGRIRVNGRIVTELGATADPRKDKIELDGRRVVREDPRYVLIHKPREVVSTLSDPEGRQHLGQVITRMGLGRLYPVGRLDFHTSGALLLTNDGELTDALLHPRRDVPKIYVAKLKGHLEIADLDALRNGVVLDDGERTKAAEVFVTHDDAKSTWVQITLYEGRNRQIHRMGDAIGHPVLRLARMSFAGLDIEGLRPGQWRELEARELEKLFRDYLTPARRARDGEDEAAAPPKARRSGPQSMSPVSATRAPGPSRSAGTKSVGTKSAGTKVVGTKSVGTKSVGTKSVGTKSVGKAPAGRALGARSETPRRGEDGRDDRGGASRRTVDAPARGPRVVNARLGAPGGERLEDREGWSAKRAPAPRDEKPRGRDEKPRGRESHDDARKSRLPKGPPSRRSR